jgi:hypothetical protein
MKELTQWLKKYATILILGILLVASVIFGINQFIDKRNWKKINDNNITALTDSIHYYKGKNGELVAEKTLLLGDMSTLKLANEELAQTIEDMKLHNPQQVVYVETEIINEVHDTTWMIQDVDTLIKKDFDFSNQWRVLNGFVQLEDKNLSLSIAEDKVLVNYTLAIKDNKVYITSDNPYVKYNEIQGITLPKTRKNFSVGIGPAISYGWWPGMTKPSPFFGVSLGLYYNLFQF